MKYRKFGKTNWQVSEIGYGMWGLAGWTGSEEKEVEASLYKAVELGCNFFDTAWGYGSGRSEQILGKLIKIKNYMQHQKSHLRILNGHRNHLINWKKFFRQAILLSMQKKV